MHAGLGACRANSVSRRSGVMARACRPRDLVGPQLGGVAREHVAEAVHVVAQPGGQQPLALRPGQGPDEQVGQDAARVRHDPAPAAVEGPRRGWLGAGCRRRRRCRRAAAARCGRSA